MSDTLKILFLAVLQGITEFLPISSSGHLVIAENFLGIHEDTLTLNIALHLGSLVSIVVFYWKDLWAVLLERQWKLVLWLGVATVPAVIVGFTLKDLMEKQLSNVYSVCGFLLVTAAILRFMHRPDVQNPRPLGELTWRDALAIGCMQALAILPGVSRSGSTISTATRMGMDRTEAARFSFFMGCIAIGGAVVLDGRKLLKLLGGAADASGQVSAITPGLLIMGFAVSAVVGYFALAGLIKVLQRGKFSWFSYYCVALAVIAAIVQFARTSGG